MSEFSPAEAALEGVRLPRERPVTVLWWWAANLAAVLAEFGLSLLPFFNHAVGVMHDLQGPSDALQRNPEDAAAANALASGLSQLMGPFLLFAAIMLLLQVVLSTAVLRAVLRPADRAFGYLRLSMDEVRQLGLAFIIIVSVLAYTFAAAIVAALVVAILSGLAGGAVPAAVRGGLTFVILGFAFIYPAVRLSLAPAMTFADGRISFLRSWALTKGRFWPMFAAYAVAMIFALAVWAAGFALGGAIWFLLSGRPEGPAVNGVRDLLSAPALIVLVLNGLIAALIGAIRSAPSAFIFRQLTGRAGPPPASTINSGSPWGQA